MLAGQIHRPGLKEQPGAMERLVTMLARQIRRRGVKEQPGAMERLVTMLAVQIYRRGVKEKHGVGQGHRTEIISKVKCDYS